MSETLVYHNESKILLEVVRIESPYNAGVQLNPFGEDILASAPGAGLSYANNCAVSVTANRISLLAEAVKRRA